MYNLIGAGLIVIGAGIGLGQIIIAALLEGLAFGALFLGK